MDSKQREKTTRPPAGGKSNAQTNDQSETATSEASKIDSAASEGSSASEGSDTGQESEDSWADEEEVGDEVPFPTHPSFKPERLSGMSFKEVKEEEEKFYNPASKSGRKYAIRKYDQPTTGDWDWYYNPRDAMRERLRDLSVSLGVVMSDHRGLLGSVVLGVVMIGAIIAFTAQKPEEPLIVDRKLEPSKDNKTWDNYDYGSGDEETEFSLEEPEMPENENEILKLSDSTTTTRSATQATTTKAMVTTMTTERGWSSGSTTTTKRLKQYRKVDGHRSKPKKKKKAVVNERPVDGRQVGQ